jgi:hypothetical protein
VSKVRTLLANNLDDDGERDHRLGRRQSTTLNRQQK